MLDFIITNAILNTKEYICDLNVQIFFLALLQGYEIK